MRGSCKGSGMRADEKDQHPDVLAARSRCPFCFRLMTITRAGTPMAAFAWHKQFGRETKLVRVTVSSK